MSGHVFVVQGDLTKLVCDEVLIPTDRWLDVGPHWDALHPLRDAGAVSSGWRTEAVRVTDRLPPVDGLPHRRMVNSGASVAADVDWLMETVDQALTASTSGLSKEAPSPGRGRRLLALPVLGTGAGGYDERRGDVIDGLLERCEAAVDERDVDIAVVCWSRADLTAVQARRSRRVHAPTGLASSLGRRARAGRLALFIGAGVSVAAGLPTWRALLQAVAAADERTAELAGSWGETQDLWAAASQLEQVLGREGLNQAVDRQLSRKRFALSHALLASLPGREAVTTNFDALFESARSVRDTPTFDVLPYRGGSEAYLLKLHGDSALGDIVLDQASLRAYNSERRPLMGLLQGLLLTRHLLFVGCSMQDDNVLRTIDEVAQLVRRHQHVEQVGTILTLVPDAALEQTWSEKGFAVEAMASASTPLPDAARALEVLLDEVLLEATYDEGAHLLDPVYGALLDEQERGSAELLRTAARGLPSGREWEGLRAALQAHGAPAAAPPGP